MWIKAAQASIGANGTIITINSGESAATVQQGDAAILGNNAPVEVKSIQQAVGGAWQLVLQDPWPYTAVTNGALRVQPNGGRFEAAIQAMRDINTYAANTHAAMNDWLTSTAATISVEKADGSSISIPTLYSYTSNWGTAALRNVGTGAGNVMEVGAGGLLNLHYESSSDLSVNPYPNGIHYRFVLTASNGPRTTWTGYVLNFGSTGTANKSQFAVEHLSNKLYYRYSYTASWVQLYHSGNTTVDGNGFIKAASPIIKLHSASIETNTEAEQQDPELMVNGVGDYTITGTSGLAKEGWYIETPKDANGNIKVFVEYEQVEQHDGTFNINVKTYKPDYSTGPATAGAPMDIPAGRWIDIRLQELPVETPDEALAE
ncbi:phage tail fiber protein [Shewanella algae]|uniref:phage tail fiber protein n=1 Tax=Shewanella algae TaxID=38313 RepID=UPI001C57AFFD|nr:hypothetical protein [Shewanella algae]